MDQIHKPTEKKTLILGKIAMAYLMLTLDILGKSVQQVLVDNFAGFYERMLNDKAGTTARKWNNWTCI